MRIEFENSKEDEYNCDGTIGLTPNEITSTYKQFRTWKGLPLTSYGVVSFGIKDLTEFQMFIYHNERKSILKLI